MSISNPAVLAGFSAHVYAELASTIPVPPGFVRLDVPGEVGPDGFFASAFYHQQTGELVIVYRGSDRTFKDWYENNKDLGHRMRGGSGDNAKAEL